MKITDLSAIHTINSQIYFELLSIVDYKSSKEIIYIERVRAIFLIF
jgi:hypothetical protein